MINTIIVKYDDETGMIEIDGDELGIMEILGVLEMAKSIIVQSDTKPVSDEFRDEFQKSKIKSRGEA